MIYIITHGEYSDKSNVAVIECDCDLPKLFDEFRELYIPNFAALVRKHGYARHIPGWWQLIQDAEKQMEKDGLIDNGTSWMSFAGAFAGWLVKNHGAKYVEIGDDFGANEDAGLAGE